MAIVKEIKSGSAVVRIDDSCCRGISPEEAARRWAEVERAIWAINRNHQMRQAVIEREGNENGES